jgi:hypothetical protein
MPVIWSRRSMAGSTAASDPRPALGPVVPLLALGESDQSCSAKVTNLVRPE